MSIHSPFSHTKKSKTEKEANIYKKWICRALRSLYFYRKLLVQQKHGRRGLVSIFPENIFHSWHTEAKANPVVEYSPMALKHNFNFLPSSRKGNNSITSLRLGDGKKKKREELQKNLRLYASAQKRIPNNSRTHLKHFFPLHAFYPSLF